MVSPRRLYVGAALATLAVLLVAMPVWLPWLGTALAEEEPAAPADVALVLEGTGALAPDAAEEWRRQGLVTDVVVVEAPIVTHALVTYWTELVRAGLAAPAPTPSEHLRVVRSLSTNPTEQARAALPALEADQAHSVLVLGGGGIGSRNVARDLNSVFHANAISLRMVRYGVPDLRDPAHWYQSPMDRRAVLDSWLQLLVPFLSEYQDGT